MSQDVEITADVETARDLGMAAESGMIPGWGVSQEVGGL